VRAREAAIVIVCSRTFFYAHRRERRDEDAANANHDAENVMSRARWWCGRERIRNNMRTIASLQYWIIEARKVRLRDDDIPVGDNTSSPIP